MRGSAILIILLALAGCATGNSISPPLNQAPEIQAGNLVVADDPYTLWGEWTFYFNEAHDQVDVVPKRAGRFHLNALKFLEEYCADCLEITNIKGNGDGTINLTVKITHPFPDNPEYTGFDVKGILMFDGSQKNLYHSKHYFPYGTLSNPSYFISSWAKLGDPEVLNADGYTVRWSPWWHETGSELPIFNYWEGKYAKGTPSSNVNAYLNFYTSEERHIFTVDGSVERTYHIALPPGSITAGYAVEAHWVPPDVTPVTDPINDIPISANQMEPFNFKFVINNGDPITQECCNAPYGDCSFMYHEFKQWYGSIPVGSEISFPPYDNWLINTNSGPPECLQVPPNDLIWLSEEFGWPLSKWYAGKDGEYRGVAMLKYAYGFPDYVRVWQVYTVFEFTIDLE
jgi:hypothetical protein